MEQYRQGDVYLEKVAAIPDGLEREPTGTIILAHGEATGHAHTITNRLAKAFRNVKTGERFIKVGGKGATLEHQEHDAIAVPPGSYRVVRQLWYSPEAISNVAD